MYRHLDGILNVIRYHGQGRETDLDVLKSSDLIITTYSTLAFEMANRKSQLDKIGWFRIVLDEGKLSSIHQSTKLLGIDNNSTRYPPPRYTFLPHVYGARGKVSLVSDRYAYPESIAGYRCSIRLPTGRAIPQHCPVPTVHCRPIRPG